MSPNKFLEGVPGICFVLVRRERLVASAGRFGDDNYGFAEFYAAMERRGVIVFPGKLTATGTFRIGCLGGLDEDDMRLVVHAVDDAVRELDVVQQAPHEFAR